MTAEPPTIRPERDVPPFWRSAAGRLIVRRCERCERPFHYPRDFCPLCGGDRVGWLECTGRGTVYSYSVARTADPYVIAYVELEEGPRIMTNIVDAAPGGVAIGLPVVVVFREVDGVAVPLFRPDPRP